MGNSSGNLIFVEMGTHTGDTAEWASSFSKKVFTIELSPKYCEMSKTRLSQRSNVQCIFGDSSIAIRDLVAQSDSTWLYWLDGHFSFGDTAGAEMECPLLQELEALEKSKSIPCILIDDAKLILSPPPPPHRQEDWPSFDDIVHALKKICPQYYITLTEDVLIAVPNQLSSSLQAFLIKNPPASPNNLDEKSTQRMLGSRKAGNSTKNDLDILLDEKKWKYGNPLKLHLGCGEQYFRGYINIDYPSSEHAVMDVKADYLADITKLDFPENSVDEIRLHHVFEHFNRVTALAMLIKWHQWLKVDGVLQIETPDIMGSAEVLVSNAPWRIKTAAIRHLTGDQADKWAYHVDHWFSERYIHTLSKLGFHQIEILNSKWPHPPHLCNVRVLAKKKCCIGVEELINSADELLLESTVSPAEKNTHAVWKSQLREVLKKISHGMANIHTDAVPTKDKVATNFIPQIPNSTYNISKIPLPEPRNPVRNLNEIYDFNQRGRDAWVANKAKSVPHGFSVLDIGAGTCLYRPHFAHCKYKTHDFKKYDGSEKHGATSQYGEIDYVSEILQIPVSDASFDVVICTEVLEHVPEPILVLKEISRILRPGGRAFITAPLGSGLHQLPYHFYGGYTPEWYKRFCYEAGMDVVEITPNGGFFRHLAQECARAANIFAQNPKLHSLYTNEFHQLLADRLPRLFDEFDELVFDERFTVGFFVEVSKK